MWPISRLVYPGDGGSRENSYLGGLEPDLLGEALIAAVLTDANTPAAYLDQVFEDANETAFRNGFLALGRISLHRETEARAWLQRLLAPM